MGGGEKERGQGPSLGSAGARAAPATSEDLSCLQGAFEKCGQGPVARMALRLASLADQLEKNLGKGHHLRFALVSNSTLMRLGKV